MASAKISSPMRGLAHRLSRLSLRQEVLTAYSPKPIRTPCRRCITTSTSPNATAIVDAVASEITTSAAGHVFVTPFEEQTVLATIHQFPSLEPLRFQTYPASHLYLPTRRDILHRAVVYEGDMTRSGTASTKTRHEIRGSAKKIRPQKGSGRARLGDKKSPMLRGGGVAFGPKPRDFSTELPKKIYDLAWRTALSYRFRKGELIIVDNAMEIESPSPRLLSDIFRYHEKIQGKGRSLLVTLEERPLLEQALIEMDRGEQTLTWEEVDVKNLLELSRIIIERDALHNILLTHQEDLTHKAAQPWHKSLVRSSPPADLEATIGWQEFRALMLTVDPKEKEAFRADAYTNTAATRYSYAESLPQGPKRSGLTVSAYKLLAEAKEIEFKQTTGCAFQDSPTNLDTDDVTIPAWPRLQILDYQIEQANGVVDRLSETSSQLSAEEAAIEVRQLELEKLHIRHEAAQLAAQVHEHKAEAERLIGQNEESEEILSRASDERTQVDIIEQEIRQKEAAIKESRAVVAALKKNHSLPSPPS